MPRRRRHKVLLAALAVIAAVACSGRGAQRVIPGTTRPTSRPPSTDTTTTTAATPTTATTTGRSTFPGGGPTTTTNARPAGTTAAPVSPAAVAASCGLVASPPSRYQHVIWIWMENHSWSQVLGSAPAAPFETSLARQCATATNYASVGSPSLPNYVGATSGGTQGIVDDASPSSHPLTGDNLFRQVRAAGGSERSYQEGMTMRCQLSSAGRYAVKHNPAAYYSAPADRAACGADDLPFTDFQGDLQSGRLPTFALVTPDLCHDTHDCSVATGDAWLAGNLPAILASPSYRSGTTAVLVIWDEYTPMPNLVVAPAVRPATVVTTPLNHYALLATTEELLGLPGRLGAAAGAPSFRGPFHL